MEASAEKQSQFANGNIFKLVLKLSIPAITAQLINALYNIVDRMYIGRMEGVGAAALTGVGVSMPIIMIISAFAALIGMGGAPLTSIRLGAGKKEEAESILGNGMALLVAVGLVLTAVFLLFKRPMLLAFGASENTLPYADSYLTIYLLGTLFVQTSLGMNAFINSQGFAGTGMVTVLIGAVLNIILDPIFIFGLGMGVQGAALATILSQAVSAVWVVAFLCSKKTILKIKRPNLKLWTPHSGQVLALGMAPFIMQSTESLVQIAFNSNLQLYGNDLYVGAMTILSSVMQVLLMPLMGFTQGAQPIIGSNYGAGNADRVKKAVSYSVGLCMVYAVAMWLAIRLAPTAFTAIFTSDPALTETAVGAMDIFFFAMFIMGAQCAFQNAFIALGKAKISVFLALLRKIILRIPLIYILPHFFGTDGIFTAEPVADFLAAVTTITVFLTQFGKIRQEMEQTRLQLTQKKTTD